MKRLLLSGSILAFTLPLSAAVLVVSTTVGTAIPDDSSTGLFSQASVSPLGLVTSVTVALNVSAVSVSQAFLGDLYVYLQHDSGISVLLNRPGRRADESFGYDDNESLNVTFSDAATGDIHNYRTVLNGNDTTPLGGALNGSWLPDGRTSDPASVLASQTPMALLSAFNGADSQGDWRLFAADLSGGAEHQLDSWTLTVDYTAVPEPAQTAAFAALGFAAFVFLRRRRKKS